jgi:transglutaminase-like putative cysteine protease
MRFDLAYRTTFRYSEPVTESQNEVRAAPATDAHQQVHAYRIDTTPRARTLRYTDAWGTHVDTFGVRDAHDHLVVAVQASVETRARPVWTATVAMADLNDPAFVGRHWEFLQPTRHTTAGDAVASIGHGCADQASDVHAVVSCMVQWVGSELRYQAGATAIGVTTDEVLARRSGVCQDYSHLLVALCRAAGIPARYVSGYFFAAGDDAPSAADDVALQTVQVQTHAWVEVAVPGAGWWAVDPTNQQPVGERHITIGRGREYDDVPPFRGVYTGEAEAEVTATVSIRRLDGTGGRMEVTSDEVLQPFPEGVAPSAHNAALAGGQ